jgi:tetratricopeptide (TPR) repeat protein
MNRVISSLLRPAGCLSIVLCLCCGTAVRRTDGDRPADSLRFLSATAEEIQSDEKTPAPSYLSTLAAKMDSLYIHAYNNRGNVYENLGETEKALRDYARAITLDSTYATAHYNRANVYQKSGRENRDYELAIFQTFRYE